MHMLKIALTQQFFDAQIHLSSSFMVTISRWPRVPTSRVVRRLRGLEEHVAIQYSMGFSKDGGYPRMVGL